LKKAQKIYNGKAASSTNVAGKTSYVYHPVQVSTQSGLKTIISDLKP
jgi:hypothetical protein